MKGSLGSRAVTIALGLALAWGGTALLSYFKIRHLRSDAQFLLTRGNAEGAAYAQTFDGEIYQHQLETFERRRLALEKTFFWHRLFTISVLGTVIALFCGYLLFLLHRLREQLVDAVEEAA